MYINSFEFLMFCFAIVIVCIINVDNYIIVDHVLNCNLNFDLNQ